MQVTIQILLQVQIHLLRIHWEYLNFLDLKKPAARLLPIAQEYQMVPEKLPETD